MVERLESVIKLVRRSIQIMSDVAEHTGFRVKLAEIVIEQLPDGLPIAQWPIWVKSKEILKNGHKPFFSFGILWYRSELL